MGTYRACSCLMPTWSQRAWAESESWLSLSKVSLNRWLTSSTTSSTLKVPQLPQAAPAGYQVFEHMSVGTFHKSSQEVLASRSFLSFCLECWIDPCETHTRRTSLLRSCSGCFPFPSFISFYSSMKVPGDQTIGLSCRWSHQAGWSGFHGEAGPLYAAGLW